MVVSSFAKRVLPEEKGGVRCGEGGGEMVRSCRERKEGGEGVRSIILEVLGEGGGFT